MLFSPEQIKDLLNVVDQHTNVFVATHLGHEYLTKEEIAKLKQVGIDATKLYSDKTDILKQSFHFGLISDAMGNDAHKVNFEGLKKYFKEGKHIPLTATEKYALDSVKKQSLSDIRAHKGRIFQDVNNIISDKEKANRVEYEKVIRDEIHEGLLKQKTVGEIARELGRKTGDWSRNFARIVEFQSHAAMSEGRVANIERLGGKKVYMDVYSGACKHCIRLYLTGGIGSKPKIFDIEEIKKNGNNIGRKVNEWLPVIPPSHPWCRCHVTAYREGSVWNDKTKRFELGKEIVITGRKPIKFTVEIDGKQKEYFV